MTKVFKGVIAGLAVAAVAAPSFAADVDISGQYRVRAHVKDNQNFSADKNDSGTESRFYDHRLRTQAKITVSDAVSFTVRSDISEGKFGTGATYASDGNDIRMDKAFMDLQLPGQLGNLRTGRLAVSLERTNRLVEGFMRDGFVYTNSMGAVDLTGVVLKASENVAANNTDGAGDVDAYALRADFKVMEGLTLAPYIARASDKSGINASHINAFGADVAFSAGMFGVAATAYMLDGDQEDTDLEYEGTVFNIDANVKPVDRLTLGAAYTFIEGDDDANDDTVKVNTLLDDSGDDDTLASYIFWNAAGYGPDWVNGSNGVGNAGVNAYKVYTKYGIGKYTVGAHYVMAEPDEGDGDFDSLGAFAAYKIYDNTTLSASAATASYDDGVDATDEDDATKFALVLKVGF